MYMNKVDMTKLYFKDFSNKKDSNIWWISAPNIIAQPMRLKLSQDIQLFH